MAEQTAPLAEARPSQPRRSRFRWLVVSGGLAIVFAFFLRTNPWLEEYQLKKASLPTLEAWAADSPKDPLVQYYLGSQYFNLERYPEALHAFEAAAAADPKMARAQSGMALVQYKVGRLNEALETARRGATLDPKSADAQFTLALLTADKSHADARLEFDRVTKLAPKRADAWHWSGVCAMDLNDPSTALPRLQRAVELEKNNRGFHRDLGKVLLTLSRFDEARPHLEFAAAQSPPEAESIYLLGRWQATMAADEKDFVRAGTLMEQSIKLMLATPNRDESNIAAVELELGDVLRQLHRLKDAVRILRDARRRDPSNLPILHRLALTLRDAGQSDEAKKLLDDYSRRSSAQTDQSNMIQRIKQDGRNPELRLRLARMLAASGDLMHALNQYDVSLWLQPKSAVALAERKALVERISKVTGAKIPDALRQPPKPPKGFNATHSDVLPAPPTSPPPP